MELNELKARLGEAQEGNCTWKELLVLAEDAIKALEQSLKTSPDFAFVGDEGIK